MFVQNLLMLLMTLYNNEVYMPVQSCMGSLLSPTLIFHYDCIASTDDYHAMILDVYMYHVVIVQVRVTKN